MRGSKRANVLCKSTDAIISYTYKYAYTYIYIYIYNNIIVYDLLCRCRSRFRNGRDSKSRDFCLFFLLKIIFLIIYCEWFFYGECAVPIDFEGYEHFAKPRQTIDEEHNNQYRSVRTNNAQCITHTNDIPSRSQTINAFEQQDVCIEFSFFKLFGFSCRDFRVQIYLLYIV